MVAPKPMPRGMRICDLEDVRQGSPDPQIASARRLGSHLPHGRTICTLRLGLGHWNSSHRSPVNAIDPPGDAQVVGHQVGHQFAEVGVGHLVEGLEAVAVEAIGNPGRVWWRLLRYDSLAVDELGVPVWFRTVCR